MKHRMWLLGAGGGSVAALGRGLTKRLSVVLVSRYLLRRELETVVCRVQLEHTAFC